MAFISNLFNRFNNARSITSQSVTVASSTTGTVYTVTKRLVNSSTLSLITGTSSNLSLSGLTVQAAVAISSGSSQTAVIRESAGSLAIEYPVFINSQ